MTTPTRRPLRQRGSNTGSPRSRLWTEDEEQAIIHALRNYFEDDFLKVVYEGKRVPATFWDDMIIEGRTAIAVKSHFRQVMVPTLKIERQRDPAKGLPLRNEDTPNADAETSNASETKADPTPASTNTKLNAEQPVSIAATLQSARVGDDDDEDSEKTESDMSTPSISTLPSVEPSIADAVQEKQEFVSGGELFSDEEEPDDHPQVDTAVDTGDTVDTVDTRAEVFQMFFLLSIGVLLYLVGTAEDWGGVSPSASRNISGMVADLVAKLK